jgi:hypothetical protein
MLPALSSATPTSINGYIDHSLSFLIQPGSPVRLCEPRVFVQLFDHLLENGNSGDHEHGTEDVVTKTPNKLHVKPRAVYF